MRSEKKQQKSVQSVEALNNKNKYIEYGAAQF